MPRTPHVIWANLGTPDAIVVDAPSGLFVLADPGLSDTHLAAITLVASVLPEPPGDDDPPPSSPIPSQRSSEY